MPPLEALQQPTCLGRRRNRVRLRPHRTSSGLGATLAVLLITLTSAYSLSTEEYRAELDRVLPLTTERFSKDHDQQQRLAGVLGVGAAVRIRNVLDKLIQGEQVAIAAVGGSITAGGDKYNWLQQVYGWLQDMWPPSGGNAIRSGRHLQDSAVQAPATGSSSVNDTQGRAAWSRKLQGALGSQAAEGRRDTRRLQREPNPIVRHMLFNGAVAGSTSPYMSSCLDRHLPPEQQEQIDLAFVEYAVNDQHEADKRFDKPVRRGYERLVRKLLQLPKHPAVVIVSMYAYCKLLPCGQYRGNAERDFGEFASYYGTPMLSMKAAAFHKLDRNESSGAYSLHDFYGGGRIHPGPPGHTLMAELVITMFLEVLAAAAAGPPFALTEAQQQEALAEGVPRPMIAGNYESDKSNCFIGDSFRLDAVSRVEGFIWRNESGKLGYVAAEPGSILELKLNTVPAAQLHHKTHHELRSLHHHRPSHQPQLQQEALSVTGGDGEEDDGEGQGRHLMAINSRDSVLIQIAYLASYEHMGMAEVECVSGCECSKTVIDGWHSRHESVSQMHEFQVSQHNECVVRLTVLEETKSPDKEHKVKIIGAVVSEEAGLSEGLVTGFGGFGIERKH